MDFSPCVLVPKADRSYRFCTDFGKVNLITKTDYYSFPCMQDCIDKIGSVEFVNKFNLLKGYCQVPLHTSNQGNHCICDSHRIIPIQSDAIWTEKCTCYFLANASSRSCRSGKGCEGYIDSIIIFSDTWEQHLQRMKQFLMRLMQV